jgi:hypothetical protein
MKRFQDKVYALSQKGLLLWEPSWDTFRPVESVVWNPAHNQLEPYFGIYTHDIFDVDYGFKDTAMHEFCIDFTDTNSYDVGGAEDLEDILEFWKWSNADVKWVGDRMMAIHPCSGDPERKKFITRYNLRSKSLRRAPRNLNSTRKIHTH